MSNGNIDEIDEVDEPLGSITRKSLVWQYATREENSDYAICKLCDGNKRISTNNGSTSTLREHLISKHGKIELVINGRKRNRSKTMSSTKREEIHQLLVNSIVRDGRPFGDFDKPGMRQLMQKAFPSKK